MKLLRVTTLLALAGCLVSASGCNQKTHQSPADLIVKGGQIYTIDFANEWVEAVAVADGRYVYIGNDDDVDDFLGVDTEVIDLNGKMAMPGINDAHLHPMEGAVKDLFECNFPFTANPEEIALVVTACVEQNPDAEWIRGGQWGSNFFVDHKIDSPREWLDKVSGGKAVFLSDDSAHNTWLNTKAFELMGIDNETPNPPGVEIVRDKVTGELNGVVLEGSASLRKLLPAPDQRQYIAAARHVFKTANKFGITGLKDASANLTHIIEITKLDRRDEMTIHFAGALDTSRDARETALDVEELIQQRDSLNSKNVDAGFVKIFTDGVPTAARTAAMLADYAPEKKGSVTTAGYMHINEAQLTRHLIALDAEGFTVKIHTAGDRSVRVALNAIAATRAANGASGLRHELAHAGYIDSIDIPRFRTLNAVADLSPYLWYPSPIITSVINAVGRPRGEQYFPIKSLLASGAPVLAGSDWPSAAANMSPWGAIEAMISRQNPSGDYPGTLWPEEAINLEQALQIFTMQNARAMKIDEKSGSVELGKLADLIVLNQNVFEVPTSKIGDTQVLRTLFSGKTVHLIKE